MEKNKAIVTKYGQKWKEKPTKKYIFKVYMEEFEREWGSKVIQTKYFKSEEDARKFCRQYNNEYNSEEEVPDWYIVASFVGNNTGELCE